MAAIGAARMILQSELTADRLANEIRDLMASPETLVTMGSAARQMARPDAAEVTVDLIEGLVKEK